MSFEQHLKDLDDIRSMKRDRKTIVKHFIEEIKKKAGSIKNNEGTERLREVIPHPLYDPKGIKRGLERTV